MPVIKVKEELTKLKLTMFSDSGVIGGAPPTPGSGTGSGWIYFEDVEVFGGTAVNKVFQDPPGNTILNEVTVSSTTFQVRVRASYPLAEVNGVSTTLIQDVSGAFYRGFFSVVLPVSGPIVAQLKTPDGDNGATDTLLINIDPAPVVTQALFTGGYPIGPGGLQTELKEDDPFDLEVTADKPFDLVDIQNFGASKGVSIPVAVTTGPVIVQIQAANQGTSPQLLAANVRVRDAVTGAFSATLNTNLSGGNVNGVNVVNLNNLAPSGNVTTVTYPATQGAIKGVEVATVNHTAIDFDTIAYTDPTSAQITISNPAIFEAAKTVTGLNAGVFNNTVTNFSYSMIRNSNGSQTTVNGIAVIADIAPVISITLPASRLISGGNNGTSPVDHVVTISSDQPLLIPPVLATDSGGNRGLFLAAFAGGPSIWTALLRVDETVPDEKGTFSFEALAAIGLAGIVQGVSSNGVAYVLGGFVARDLTFPAFSQQTQLGTEVNIYANLQAAIFDATNQPALLNPVQGDTSNIANTYTVLALDTNPSIVFWNDADFAGANSTGTAKIIAIEELP